MSNALKATSKPKPPFVVKKVDTGPVQKAAPQKPKPATKKAEENLKKEDPFFKTETYEVRNQHLKLF